MTITITADPMIRYGFASLVLLLVLALFWWARDDAFKQGETHGKDLGKLEERNTNLEIVRRSTETIPVRHKPLPEGMSMIATADLRLLKAMALKGLRAPQDVAPGATRTLGSGQVV